MDIEYVNRGTGQVEVEKVYGDGAVKWLYNSSSGKALSDVLAKPMISKLYGFFQSKRISLFKIDPFVRDYQIDLNDFEPEDGAQPGWPYSSFNSFFIRKFRPGRRTIVNDESKMPAFSEARYYAYDSITDDLHVPVKGKFLSSKGLISHPRWAEVFHEGPLLLARLCPVDYHRFHFPDDGNVMQSYSVGEKLHSVNPVALVSKPDIFVTNERQVTILDTKNFGKLAYIEVGAIMVGKIVQSHHEKDFQRGKEKGYFLFGGSTVIVMGEKGKWKPSQDIVANTKKGMETYIQLGDEVAFT